MYRLLVCSINRLCVKQKSSVLKKSRFKIKVIVMVPNSAIKFDSTALWSIFICVHRFLFLSTYALSWSYTEDKETATRLRNAHFIIVVCRIVIGVAVFFIMLSCIAFASVLCEHISCDSWNIKFPPPYVHWISADKTSSCLFKYSICSYFSLVSVRYSLCFREIHNITVQFHS